MAERFVLQRVSGLSVSDEQLLDDLRKVASALGKRTVGQKEYRPVGAFDDSTISRRFGSWNKALMASGLELSNVVSISDEQLFANILVLWSHYGRQPRRRELALPPSTISQTPYSRRFGSWRAALDSFVSYANAQPGDAGGDESSSTPGRKTPRDPSLRLRFRVMQRDAFACRGCGASPAKTPGVELHVDHVLPWSRGGETTLDNLQTLCRDCNLGKGDTL